MTDKFTRIPFEKIFNVEKIITIFYMELSKNFYYDGEKHDFWEMVYIDKGEMICTADEKRYILKSGEMTFHKPNEFHNLSGNNTVAPNVCIITFECKSRMMKHFEGKIFRLNADDKALLSSLISEGLSCYQLEDQHNPLLQKLLRIEDAPFGSSQMTKNLLEIFLIKLFRNKDIVKQENRQSFEINGINVPYNVKELIDYLEQNIYKRISIPDIAHHMGKSESTIKQVFAKYTSGGIMRYYKKLKIKEARRLIRESNYNMTQISNMLQFDSPQYFTRCFKDVTHMTPREYKSSINKQ